ncbi:MAG: CYTH domain-containing protein [Deltaproteobacteria bacterium]|nr:MAG: CYTH domain-containing protein [Deltaproteobacteria bacterium]
MTAAREEVEAKLIVCGAAPARIADALAAAPRLDGYALGPVQARTLRDTYLDTPARALGDVRFALRIRRCDGEAWIALKGPDRGAGFEGAVRRSELELPWSDASLRRVTAALGEAGVRLEGPAGPAAGDPVATLEACGLAVIQDRETHRRVRDVRDAAGASLAELAIDCVHHRLGDREVQLFEVEVEVTGESDPLHAIVRALEARYPQDLRRWPHDKLATGLALQRICEAGGLDPLVRADSSLRPEGYAAIDRELRERGP